MKTNPLLSIIVPVYNTEKYLYQCLDSLCSQTYQNIEIIVINDGSPDNCYKIMRNFSARDNRIIIIEKDNGGLSSARNAGIAHAKGEYVTFLDSDDWVDSNYYYELMKYTSQSPHLICGSFKLNKDGEIHKSTQTYISTSPSNSIEILYNTYYGMIYNVWGKIFKKDIIINNKLQFRHIIREDGIFLLDYYAHISEICIVAGSSYLHYNTENTESITHKAYGINKVMLVLFTYYNSFNKIIETDFDNYDKYIRILNMDKTKSFCDILHETYSLPYKEKLYWYKRMIDQLPHFVLSKYTNKPIYKMFKIAFKLKSSILLYTIIKMRLGYLKIISTYDSLCRN